MLAKAHEGNPQLHLDARNALESVVESFPEFANAWAWLGGMYRDEFVFWINEKPDPLKRAEQAAQRALRLNPTNQEALLVLTDVRFYQGDLDAFRRTADQALELHPNSPDLLSVVASHLAHSGFYEEAHPLAQRAVDLTPQPTLHMLGNLALCFYGKARYALALDTIYRVWSVVDRSNITGMQAYYLTLLVAACGQLNKISEAQETLAAITSSIPSYARIMGPSWKRQGTCEELQHHLEAGLKRVGLEIVRPSLPA